MGFGDDYISIFNAVKTEVAKAKIVRNATEYTFDEVYQGPKERIDKWPCAVIIPKPSPLSPASTKRDYLALRFHVVVCTKNPNYLTGLKDAMDFAGSVYDNLVDDRTLGGKVDNLEVSTYDPESAVHRGLTRHYVTVIVDCFLARVS